MLPLRSRNQGLAAIVLGCALVALPVAPAAAAKKKTTVVKHASAKAAAATVLGTPFSPTSFWNKKLADSAPIDPNSDKLVSDLVRQVGQYGTWINTTQYSTPIYQPASSQSRSFVKLDYTDVKLQADFSSVPIPAGAKPSAGTDGSMTVYQPSTDSLWEFWGMRQASDGWHAKWGGKMGSVSSSSGVYPYPYGVEASGLSLLGGIIRPDDIRNGVINHPVGFTVPEATAGVFRWPATRTDGTFANAGIPEGTIFRLDPSIDIRSLKLPWAAGVIAQAAQQYGLIVNDKGGAVSFYGEDPNSIGSNPWPSLFENRMPNQMLANFPWAKLKVVAVPGI